VMPGTHDVRSPDRHRRDMASGHAARSPLGKIFGDLIERVRFARTLSWRDRDSNHRSRVRPATTIPRGRAKREIAAERCCL
jgi:hypothetical protein